MATIEELRGQLDEIDRQIVSLYEQRMRVCAQVGEYKIKNGRKVLDRQRERDKLQDVAGRVSSEFNRKGIRELYGQLMSMSRKLQYQQLVEAGALGRLPFIGVDSLEAKRARVVFPGTDGAYSQAATKDYFGEGCNSFYVRTFREAMEAIEDGAADFAVLPIEDNINDNENNSTRFIIVTNQKIFLKDAKKISICLEVPHESGSLYQILSHFIYNDLNMTRIESRPVEGRNWEYRFFIDFEGNMGDAAVKNAIRGLREESRGLRILGNY